MSDNMVNELILSLKDKRAALEYVQQDFNGSPDPHIPNRDIIDASVVDRYLNEKRDRLRLKKDLAELLKQEDDMEASLIGIFQEVGCKRIDAYREGFDNPVCAYISERDRKIKKNFHGIKIDQSPDTKEFEIKFM